MSLLEFHISIHVRHLKKYQKIPKIIQQKPYRDFDDIKTYIFDTLLTLLIDDDSFILYINEDFADSIMENILHVLKYLPGSRYRFIIQLKTSVLNDITKAVIVTLIERSSLKNKQPIDTTIININELILDLVNDTSLILH